MPRLPPLACLLALLCAADARATQYALRPDLGVAAVDARTGQLLWEAWTPADVPPAARPAAGAAVAQLLTDRPATDNAAAEPFNPGPGLTVGVTFTPGAGHTVALYRRGADGRAAPTLLRSYTSPVPTSVEARLGDLLLARQSSRTVIALDLTAGGAQWKPAWTFAQADRPGDPAAAVDADGHDGPIASVRVVGDQIWVARGSRVTALDAAGRVLLETRIAGAADRSAWHSPGKTEIRPGDAGRVYFVHPEGVVALDRSTAKELWRRSTYRGPYAPELKEVGDHTLLMTVGSDAPQGLQWQLALLPKDARSRGRAAHPPQRVLAAARLLHAHGDGWPRPAVRAWADRHRAGAPHTDADHAAVAAELDRLHAAWPPHRDEARLMKSAIDGLTPPPGAPPAPSDRELCWGVLQERIWGCSPVLQRQAASILIWRSDGKPLALRLDVHSRLANECRRVLRAGPPAERGPAASVLLSPTLAITVGAAELDALARDADPDVWPGALYWAERREDRAHLIALAAARPRADRRYAAAVVARRLPRDPTPAERDFWTALATDQPLIAADALGYSRPLPRALLASVLPQIRRHLERERTAPTGRLTGGDYSLPAAVNFVAAANDPTDTALLRELLAHPGHHAAGTSARRDGRQVDRKQYVVRYAARVALEARGQAVPAAIGYEEDVLGDPAP
ncbi:MAG TPA: PQQ-binding-like beta-propeller repeat protein [Tepidisphaeraceae bacterium]|nr:PQQ-binding-like beta-propeller repeat protein [Tepidisphaeraceae bacterium]